nr:L,D-transpeptidase family protein [Pontibaca salina]
MFLVPFFVLFSGGVGVAQAQVTAFKQAVAEAAADDDDVAAYYRQVGYAPLWTGEGEEFRARRAALFHALENVPLHGLASRIYDIDGLIARMKDVGSSRELGLVEVALSRTFIAYAQDVQTGMLVPSEIDSGIVREVAYRNRTETLNQFAHAVRPADFIATLPPETPEYRALMKAKLDLEKGIAEGGWGPVVQGSILRPGETGDALISLRNRLISMGYMARSASHEYDATLQAAVQAFQIDHGLQPDGIAGPNTLAQINVPMEDRLKSVIVALERERWFNMDRGARHILVNMTDFSTRIIDRGEVTFETRSVIGKNTSALRSPEFSDMMTHMVVNPSWYVPRSIVTQEYLPQLRRNPHAVGHIEITDSRGRRVNRDAVDFSQYSARNFPFSMRQPPSNRNALGLVKFMFPNKYSIYLHDTPSKSLFNHDTRAFSHGCIRLADPFDFAYALLSRQTDNPKGLFHSTLNTGRETRINIEPAVPVHLIYRTAFTGEKGRIEYRGDVYGRDARIWEALERTGVALAGVQG